MGFMLQGRRCLITGASAGIGAGIVEALAREGARVVATARRKDPRMTGRFDGGSGAGTSGHITGTVIPVDGAGASSPTWLSRHTTDAF